MPQPVPLLPDMNRASRALVRVGFVAYDGQLIDDARLVTAVARTAAQHGVSVLTRASAHTAQGDSIRLVDELTGESVDLKAQNTR
ncbi:MAG: hypothetical protein WBN99_07345 [Mycobacterium sp.]